MSTLIDASDASPSADVTDGATDAPTDAPFMTAMHNPLYVIPNHGGPTMQHVQLVVITYADDPNRPTLEAMGQWIGTSDWLMTVGAEYHIGAGTVLGNVELTDTAPTAVTSTDIENFILDGVTNGSLPSPADHDYSNVLYMIFYPQSTTITMMQNGMNVGVSCQAFEGYHSEMRRNTLHLTYAAIPACARGLRGSGIGGEELALSHEYIEAATDPYYATHPAYQVPLDGSSAWVFVGGEVGDLCELSNSAYVDGNYTVTRVWSNQAAMADTDPCIPANPTRPYFNVSIDPGDFQFASPGDTLTYTLTGFSFAPMSDWMVNVQQSGGTFQVDPVLDNSTINNGQTANVTIQVPASAASGDYAYYLVQSQVPGTRTRQVWPIGFVIH